MLEVIIANTIPANRIFVPRLGGVSSFLYALEPSSLGLPLAFCASPPVVARLLPSARWALSSLDLRNSRSRLFHGPRSRLVALVLSSLVVVCLSQPVALALFYLGWLF